MYKYLIPSPYIIDKEKARQYFDELLIRLNAPGIKGTYSFLEELLRLMAKFYSSISRPTFGHQFMVDKRESPSSEKMNKTWTTFDEDLHTIFAQQNNIDESLVINFNYFQVKKENILNKVKTCSEKLNIASAITQSKDSPIFEIKENFDVISNIDVELIPEREMATYDQSLGGITLRSSLGTRVDEKSISKFEVKIYWNGEEVNEEELLNSPNVNDGKLYGVHADRGENGIRIGLTSLSKAPEYVSLPEELEEELPTTEEKEGDTRTQIRSKEMTLPFGNKKVVTMTLFQMYKNGQWINVGLEICIDGTCSKTTDFSMWG